MFDVLWSCPSRGTWIEIWMTNNSAGDVRVVPLTGHVDRNTYIISDGKWVYVVPLTGHVDRNPFRASMII